MFTVETQKDECRYIAHFLLLNRTLFGWIQHLESRLLYRITRESSLVGPTDAALSCVLVSKFLAYTVMSYVSTLLPISECVVLFGGQEAEMGPLCIAVSHLT